MPDGDKVDGMSRRGFLRTVPVALSATAGGMSGAVAESDADGYTLLLGNTSTLVISPLTYKNVNYDAVKGFAPIALLGTTSNLLIVNPALPATSVQELIALAGFPPGRVESCENVRLAEERKTLASSMVSAGIAFPHAVLDENQQTHAAVEVSPGGIVWETPDRLVHVVVFLVGPRANHLSILAELASRLREPAAPSAALHARAPGEIHAFHQLSPVGHGRQQQHTLSDHQRGAGRYAHRNAHAGASQAERSLYNSHGDIHRPLRV